MAPSRVPPWFVPKAEVCKKTIIKKNCSDEMVKRLFLEHDETHGNAYKIYTDGSKSVEGVGLALVTEDYCEVAKLPNVASIYTAELSAINRALALVHQTNKKNFVIYSDSRSALESLNSYNSPHPLVLKAREWLWFLRHGNGYFGFPANINLLGACPRRDQG